MLMISPNKPLNIYTHSLSLPVKKEGKLAPSGNQGRNTGEHRELSGYIALSTAAHAQTIRVHSGDTPTQAYYYMFYNRALASGECLRELRSLRVETSDFTSWQREAACHRSAPSWRSAIPTKPRHVSLHVPTATGCHRCVW